MSVALPFGVSRPVKTELDQEDPKKPMEKKLPESISFPRIKTFPKLRMGEGRKTVVTTQNAGNPNELMEKDLQDEHLPRRPEYATESLLLSYCPNYMKMIYLPAVVGVAIPGDGEMVALVTNVDDLTSAETENDVLSSTLDIYCPRILSMPPEDD